MTASQIELEGAEGRSFSVSTGLFIDNKFVPATDNATLEVENPATGKHLATVSAAQKADVDIAVASSKKAFASWRKTSPSQRRDYLLALATALEKHASELASLEALDAGILYRESMGLNVSQALENLRYFAGWADKVDGETLTIPEGFAYTRREPIGVCAAIVPWNSPLMITMWKLAPCLATGNTMTPELCPLYAQKLGEIIVEAGIPPGVVNIVCGLGQVAGAALSEHMDISFTGSPGVGRQVLAASAKSNLKKVTLELGGKGPSIVFDDADWENALMWTSLGISVNNGQICVAGSRIYVQDTIYDKFVKEFSARTAESVHGDPLLPETTKGPVISAGQRDRILSFVDKGRDSGAKLLHGGRALDSAGHFVANTAFSDVKQDASIMQQEIFGPFASIAPFKTEEEVIAKANDTVYGLGAAVFTKDLGRAYRVTEAIEAGQVTVNMWGTVNANTPFGGVKESGFGRDMGKDAIEEWTSVKVIKWNMMDKL
ncbi:LOW QUALITY PROTEIN: aldehyde dehydrogenase domain-containing protein [Microdochium trichocladiopsis]|uniref:aldehyde dehydrogenase (NAD(+)) n=1 Tax=Microdochium trichocladiopsis TaxID=1682393 RepID=A0A9P8Y689_9PEZI|nr:LOW QUALITY PROTEIN: aldehyde dehydrogenase domain-containing protein [Microdochium trichocladiopsis]KAH7028911.1 LOW QUALITY PROTEIN: aldehyde dehydrogenase domain-containing protein [Microdochium trichocladiopsis]